MSNTYRAKIQVIWVSYVHLNFNSNNLYRIKKGTVNCLQHRPKTISSDTDAFRGEMISLRHNLYRNNYPEPLISAPRNRDWRIEDITRKFTTVCVPYVKGLSEGSKRYVLHMTSGQYSQVVQLSGDISSVSSHQLNSTWPGTVFTPSPASVVKYTKVRQVAHKKARQKEHRKTIVRGEIEKSGIADHIWKEKGIHLPLWNEVEIIDRAENWRIRRL